MAKATKIEKEKRLFTIQGWILDGVHDNLILKQTKTQWGLSLRQAKRYLREATEGWKREGDISIEIRREAKIAELKHDKRSLRPEYKGTPAGMKAKLAIDKELSKLEGLYPPRQHEFKGEVNVRHQVLNIDPLESYDPADDGITEDSGT